MKQQGSAPGRLTTLLREANARVAAMTPSSHYEHMTKGGNFRPFLRHWRLGRDMLPTPKVARRLRSRGQIKRHIVAELDDMKKQRTLFEILASIPPGGAATDEDRNAVFNDLEGQMESHRRLARQAIENAAWQERFAEGELPETVRDFAVRLKPGVKLGYRAQKTKVRKAVKRAAVLAAALLGASTVSAFARGEPVMLPGPEITLSARLTASIGSSGHGALQIGLHGADGAKLSGLCLYQEAPALDQLVSLAMHVQSGCAGDLLATGNLYGITPAADDHPVMTAHRQFKRGSAIDVNVIGEAIAMQQWQRPVPRDERAMFEAGRDAYVAETQAIYEDILATAMFGSASAIWRKHRTSLTGDGNG